MTMDPDHIRREIVRLSPWYFRIELPGVATDITPPCDTTGHRAIVFPAVRPGFWNGATVLDVACAEGAWGFGALGAGAAQVLAFDCRDSHLEKARFVRDCLGYSSIDFELASCDQWIQENAHRSFDHVLFCGIIYHLPRPWETLKAYCNIAKRSVLISSPLWGGTNGYTLWSELDNIAASEDSLDSHMPNTVETIIETARPFGFVPTHIQVTGHVTFHRGCAVLLERLDGRLETVDVRGERASDVMVNVGRQGDEVSICLFSNRPSAWEAEGRIRVTGSGGARIERADTVRFPRYVRPEEHAGSSDSPTYRIPLDRRLADEPEFDVELELGASGSPSLYGRYRLSRT